MIIYISWRFFYGAYKKITSYNTNYQWYANNRLNYQWQTSMHFNWPMVGQFDIIFLYKAPSILCKFRIKRSSHHLELRLHSPENTAFLFLHEVLSLAPYLDPFQCYDSRSLVVFVFVCLQVSTVRCLIYLVILMLYSIFSCVFLTETNAYKELYFQRSFLRVGLLNVG